MCTRFTSIGGQDTSQPLPYNPSSTIEAQIRSSLATSLRQLRTTYLDSYVLHSPLETYAETLEAWRVLVGFQDEVVQNRWYERNSWDREVVEWCRANGAQYQ